jgi:hypothetical protein
MEECPLHSQTFDTLTRSLTGIPIRRDVLRGLAGLGIGLTTIHSPVRADAKRKNKDRKRNKPKKNEFGCLDVGKKCNGKNQKCCSGICKGKRPKKGKKDKSKCIAHGTGGCQAGQDLCLGDDIPCGPPGAFCYRTTGNASFCAELGFCMNCQKDTDCEPTHGPGAACVVCVTCGGDIDTSCFSASV